MRRWRLLVLVLVVVLITVACVRKYERQAQQRRDANYQASLQSYAQKFPSGTSRKVVEEYFRNRNISFRQEFGSGSIDALSDLVSVGKEPAPWYCSDWRVYVAFDFANSEKHDWLDPHDSDSLQKIRLYRIGEGCL